MKKKSSNIAHRTPLIVLAAFVLGLLLPVVGMKIWTLGQNPKLATNTPPAPLSADNTLADAIETTNSARAEYKLRASIYVASALTGGEAGSIINLATGKTTPIVLPADVYPFIDSGVGHSILLAPKNGDSSSVYIVGAYKGYRGPIYRINLGTGATQKLKNGANAEGMVVSPFENTILIPNGTLAQNSSCVNKSPSQAYGCPEETYSFTLLDLETDTSTIVGNLPDGYSYSYTNYSPNMMSDDLVPFTSARWELDGSTKNPNPNGLIYVKVYSTKTPLCPRSNFEEGASCTDENGKTITARTALKEITLTPDQQNVQF